MKFLLFLLSCISLVGIVANAQRVTGENKDLLASLNWKKWSPDPVPVFSAEESLAKFKVRPASRSSSSPPSPWSRIPSSWIGTIREDVGRELRTYMIDLDGSNENERKSRVMVRKTPTGMERWTSPPPSWTT